MWVIVALIFIPLIMGVFFLWLPPYLAVWQERFSLVISLVLLYMVYQVSLLPFHHLQFIIPENSTGILHSLNTYFIFSTKGIRGVFLLILGFLLPVLTLIINTRSSSLRQKKNSSAWFWISVGLLFAMLLTDNIYTWVLFWGCSTIPLFMVLSGNKDATSSTAKKTLIIHGGSYGFIITGAVMAVSVWETSQISQIQTTIAPFRMQVAFWFLLLGAIIKMGVFPFHSWVIDWGRQAGGKLSLVWPLFLERLGGLYLLISLTHEWFILTSLNALLLMGLASITIIYAIIISFTESTGGENPNYIMVLFGGFMLMGAGTATHIGTISALMYFMVSGVILGSLYLLNGEGGLRIKKMRPYATQKPDYSHLFYLPVFKHLPVFLTGLPSLGLLVSHFFLLAALWMHGQGSSFSAFLRFIWIATIISGISGIMVNARILHKHFTSSPSMTKQIWNGERYQKSISILLLMLISIVSGIFIVPSWHSLLSEHMNMPLIIVWKTPVIALLILSLVISVLMSWAIFTLMKTKGKRLLFSMEKLDADGTFDVYELAYRLVFIINRPLSKAHDGILQTYVLWVFVALVMLFILL